MKRIICALLLMVIMAFPAYAVDLSDYPDIFLQEVRIVIGKASDAEDVVGAIDIMTSLQQRVGRSRRLTGAVLDTEVDDLKSMNSIVVGGPCINSAAAFLLNYPANCLEGFEPGKGMIKLYAFDNGKIALLAAGTMALDTRRVTSVLAHYADYALSGTEMIIAGRTTDDITVR